MVSADSTEWVKHSIASLASNLDVEAPGYGADVLDQMPRHWATAYGLVLRACARVSKNSDLVLPEEWATKCASWLLEDQGSRTNFGWGIPIARRTFNIDPTIEPEFPYAVPTAFACLGLVEFCTTDSFSVSPQLKDEVSDVVGRAIDEFIQRIVHIDTHRSFMPYSLHPKHTYDVINTSALWCSTIQRAVNAGIIGQPHAKYAHKLARHVVTMSAGRMPVVGWNYFGLNRPPKSRPNKPNDAMHEGYVWSALLDYGRNGGSLPDWIHQSLGPSMRRYVHGDVVHELPLGIRAEARLSPKRPHPAVDRSSRLWGAGLTWALLLDHDQGVVNAPDVAAGLERMNFYYCREGRWMTWVESSDQSVRQVAGALWALSDSYSRYHT